MPIADESWMGFRLALTRPIQDFAGFGKPYLKGREGMGKKNGTRVKFRAHMRVGSIKFECNSNLTQTNPSLVASIICSLK